MFLIVCFFLFSCDPVDERLIFINEEEEKYIQLMCFSGNDFQGYIRGKSPSIIYEGSNNFPILGSWRAYAKNENYMILRIYDKKEFEELYSIYNEIYGKGNYIDTQIADTLIAKNKFVDKKIHFSELKRNGWVVRLD